MQRHRYGQLADGTSIDRFVLSNAQGTEVHLISFGAIVSSIRVADRNGRMADVALGFDALEGWVVNRPHFGAIIGRVANRTAHGRFTLNGRQYQLATNAGENHIHGGVKGFDRVAWTAEAAHDGSAPAVVMRRRSADGEEGYPGNLDVEVRYTLTDANVLVVQYTATTDAPTPVNLTNHTYFNLAGHNAGSIVGHRATVYASSFTPVTAALIPTGTLASVAGTPFDLREGSVIGDRISQAHEQLVLARGFDHNFVLDGHAGQMNPAARVVDPVSGRFVDVATTEPGVQFYTGNFLDGTVVGKGGHVYEFRNGFCLETQHFPDSMNQPAFPSILLKPGATFRSETRFTFGAE